MIGFRDQQHRAAARGAVAHLPLHAEAIGNRREAGLQDSKLTARSAALNTTRMKKCLVSTSLNVEDVLPVMGQERRNRGNDAGAIGAG